MKKKVSPDTAAMAIGSLILSVIALACLVCGNGTLGWVVLAAIPATVVIWLVQRWFEKKETHDEQ